MYTDQDIRKAYKYYLFEVINHSPEFLRMLGLRDAFDIFNPINTNRLITAIYKNKREEIRDFLSIKYEDDEAKLKAALKDHDDPKISDSKNFESVRNTFQDTICKQFQNSSRVPREKTCRLTHAILRKGLDLGEFSKKLYKKDPDFLKYAIPVTEANAVYQICNYSTLISMGFNIQQILTALFDLDELYFKDEDLARKETFEFWCEGFKSNPEYWTTAVIRTKGKMEIVGYVDFFLTDSAFYYAWKLGNLPISDFHKVFQKTVSLNKLEETYLYIDVLVIDERKLSQQCKNEIFFEFRKFIQNKLDSLVQDGYNVKSVIAHGYTSFGIKHLLLSNFKKITESSVKDKHGDPTFLFEKKYKKDIWK